jgi:hypothetical protein
VFCCGLLLCSYIYFLCSFPMSDAFLECLLIFTFAYVQVMKSLKRREKWKTIRKFKNKVIISVSVL